LGYSGQYIANPDWIDACNIIDFPYGYEPDESEGTRTYLRYGDMIITYLSAVAPDYAQSMQSCGWSAGGQPALDVAIRLNSTYRDARYAVSHVTLLDVGYCLEQPDQRIGVLVDNSVDGRRCWVDSYAAVNKYFYANVLNVDTLSHSCGPSRLVRVVDQHGQRKFVQWGRGGGGILVSLWVGQESAACLDAGYIHL